jgi:hypothetical protein
MDDMVLLLCESSMVFDIMSIHETAATHGRVIKLKNAQGSTDPPARVVSKARSKPSSDLQLSHSRPDRVGRRCKRGHGATKVFRVKEGEEGVYSSFIILRP